MSVVSVLPTGRASEPAAVSTTSVRQAHSTFVARLVAERPSPIPVGDPRPDDFEDRAEHVRAVCGQFTDYLRAIAWDAAANSHGIDEGSINALLNDTSAMLSDLAGEIRAGGRA